MPMAGSRQLVEKHLRLFEIGHGEAFGEPAVDRREKVAGFLAPTLLAPQPGEHVPLTQGLHRLRCRRSSARAQQTKPIRVWPPTCRLRSEETSWQTNRPPDRPYPSLRAAPGGFEGNDRAPRSPKQSYQTTPRRGSATPPNPPSAQPKTNRRPLPSHSSCNERRLP